MAESPALNSEDIHPLLRQRMMNRSATFTEGVHQSTPPPFRRRSSTYSDTRHPHRPSDNFSRASGNDEMEKLTTADEPSFWHSAPLVFAIVPAIAGLLFQNGGAVVMDILLLGFGSMFLNWCLRSPWEWYQAAQQVKYIDAEVTAEDTIPEEDVDSDAEDVEQEHSAEPKPADQPGKPTTEERVLTDRSQESARLELQSNELLALLACFIGPVLGAYGLHAIRSQLTRPTEGLVSNFNLTIFVMAAELRPVSHVIKLKQARMLHLQRIVRSDQENDFRKADIQELSNRLVDLENRVSPKHNAEVEVTKIGATVRQSIQPQLDALNRAVRRYEKRQAAQSMQIEARFQELESRLRDALALAAAAARTGQRPGVFSIAMTWAVSIVTHVVQTSWAIVMAPFRTTAAALSSVQALFKRAERQPRKRIKAQSNGVSGTSTSISNSRAPSRSGR